MSDALRVGNCSGFYGDRLGAMREMLEGGDLDVLTGDYLAELTMLILGRDQLRDPSAGYARTFLKQATECLALALRSKVRIVSNAGGLNPAGLAEQLRKIAADQGLDARIAYVDGDNLMPRAGELDIGGSPLTANAYLGAFGIAEALREGADVVVTGRVTDASVVVGPAIHHFGWGRDDLDALAGAVVAGHVIECGCQATGGNYSGFRELVEAGRADRPLGFPVAEIAADGSSVITKHPGTGGMVTVDTVTAQLVYEVQSQRYLGPDVTARLDTVAVSQEGTDRVLISGARGEAPPPLLKVCVNELGGHRNQMELVLTGLGVEAKAAWVRSQVEAVLGDRRPAEMDWSLARTDHPDASTEEAASARLRLVVRDPSPDKVGKALTAPLIELALASYPGFTATTPPMPATPYGVYRAAYVPQAAVEHVVHHHDGSTTVVPPPDSHLVGGRGRHRPRVQPPPSLLRRSGGARPIHGPGGGVVLDPLAATAGGRACRDPHSQGAARQVRARAVGGQGRRRQPRAVGERTGRACRGARSLVAAHRDTGVGAGPAARDGRAARAGAPAAQPERSQRRRRRPAGSGCRGEQPLRPAGEGPR